ncbi:thiamine phosphate synthase [Pelagicoccus mobilis]|uniref:Thiamine-phosphate synthase n=1 Tax=Pelagicoccus mobilis TaxID=415221 RepID=A0A934VLM8_9BACT|nr:thiamine phosphate synthase [Pelagicoccus mobilis]MBK1877926.1 thiamine phosphate synthase [Pelagicoccus mobilis]
MLPIDKISFYGILDTGYVTPEAWTDKYQALAAGGAGIIQIRAKGSTAEQRLRLTEQILALREALDTPLSEQPHLVINDDIDLCLRFPGLGLHVGQDDLPAKEARQRLGPDRILGLSTHSPDQAERAIALGSDTLSYFAVGPVFATQTKPTYTPVGLELVRYVAKLAPQLPYFCIGGINRGNINQVKQAGAKRIVTVSDVLCDADTNAAVQQSIKLVEA